MASSDQRFDVAVLGAGIVGLGIAWAASKSGATVLIVEGGRYASGATIRNFGMIWPIGQPLGVRRQLALANRSLWIELASKAGLPLEECGSFHLAHHRDELQVLEEFCEMGEYPCEILGAKEALAKTSFANPDGLLGAMWSPLECRVDPRRASMVIAKYLESLGVQIEYSTRIVRAEGNHLIDSHGRTFHASRTYVCSGADLWQLFPGVFSRLGLRRCSLQMLCTERPSNGIWLGPHLASGLTLRHYDSFAVCPSQSRLRKRISEESSSLDKNGIHVMVSQYQSGEFVLGDSHLYDDEIIPFRSEEIDNLILSEVNKVFRLPTMRIRERWTGEYLKHTEQAWLHFVLGDGMEGVNGLGGAGMSMALSLTDAIVQGSTLPQPL